MGLLQVLLVLFPASEVSLDKLEHGPRVAQFRSLVFSTSSMKYKFTSLDIRLTQLSTKYLKDSRAFSQVLRYLYIFYLALEYPKLTCL